VKIRQWFHQHEPSRVDESDGIDESLDFVEVV